MLPQDGSTRLIFLLFEMIDKTLYGLHATQRHKEIREIFNCGVKLNIHTDASLTIIVMISGSERIYFQTHLLDFDAFLIIFHFVRDSL